MLCPWCEKKIPEGDEFCPKCGGEIDTKEEEEINAIPSSLSCLRCDGIMESQGISKIQLGEYGLFLGDLSNLLSGALEVEIFQCNQCGKIELFAPRED